MSNDKSITRRDALKLGLGAGALLTLSRTNAFALPLPLPSPWGFGEQAGALIQRSIPSSGEKLPIIGIGTAVIYSHRTYGKEAGTEMSAWLEKHGPRTERTLMKWDAMPKPAAW